MLSCVKQVANWCLGTKRNKEQALLAELEQAKTYAEYASVALQLDELLGHNAWKKQIESSYYNYSLIATRVKRLQDILAGENVHQLVRVLRSELFRKLGGISNPKLHSHCYVGTKHLIEEYEATVCKAITYICDTDFGTNFNIEDKFEFFFETRQAFGRSALCLSGGATLGMYHLGVLKALHQQDLLPRVISGSSVGSIIASMVSVRTNEELDKIFSLEEVHFDAFETKGSYQRKIWRLLTRGVLMDVQKLETVIRSNLGDITFLEAYDRTHRILNITVSSPSEHEMPRLLNYLTAPNVLIWSAAAASCALAFLYEPVSLMAKDMDGNIVPYHPSGLKWSDGSVENDLPMQRLSELFNINHFIVSQVNPHVLPFLKLAEDFKDTAIGKMLELVGDELTYRCTQMGKLGIWPSLAVVVNQKYSGDVTIVPDYTIDDYMRLLANPDVAWMRKCMERSERKTWEKITHIKHSLAIELMLDKCMKKAEAQMKHSLPSHGDYNPYAFMYKKATK